MVCDRIGYGSWVVSPLNYFQQNLMEGKLAGFGRLPGWVFFKFMVLNLPPLSAVAVVLAGWGIWSAVKSRDPLLMRLLVITIPFFVVHSMLAWKELRFLFPILPAMLVFAIHAGQEAASQWWGRLWFRVATGAGLALNLAGLIVFAFKPAFHRVPLFQKLLELEGSAVALTFAGSGDPYSGPGVELSYRFYQNPKLKWSSAANPAELDAGLVSSPAFVYSMKCPPPPEFEARLQQCTIVYERFPSWVKHFNFNDWMGRASCDRVYHCD
jgi:phosphatidylinositol glycan class B